MSVPETAANAEYHFSAEDLERVFVDAGDWRDSPQSAAPDRQDAFGSAGAATEPPNVVVDEGVGMEDITLEGERIRIEAPPEEERREVDLDSTDELEILRHVPDSAYPEDEDEDEIEREIAAIAQRLSEEPAPSAEVPRRQYSKLRPRPSVPGRRQPARSTSAPYLPWLSPRRHHGPSRQKRRLRSRFRWRHSAGAGRQRKAN